MIIRTLLMNVPLEQAIDEPRMYNFCMVNTAYYEEGFQEQVRTITTAWSLINTACYNNDVADQALTINYRPDMPEALKHVF